MTIHNVVDLSPLYFKYKALTSSDGEKGGWNKPRMKRLTATCQDGTEKDVTIMYHVLKEIEGFRRSEEKNGNVVYTTVCFDSKNYRNRLLETPDSDEYKTGRKLKLDEQDRADILEIKEMLEVSGVSTMMIEGFEADDLIYYVVERFKDMFDRTVVYTNDKDMMVNISSKVDVMRYKTTNGWTRFSIDTYEELLSAEFKTPIPYNSIGFFLCTVGDHADKVKGIHGFGVRAYENLVKTLNPVIYTRLKGYDELEELIIHFHDKMEEEKFNQMVRSFNLVRPIEVSNNPEDKDGKATDAGFGIKRLRIYLEDSELPGVLIHSSKDKREKAYSRYGFKSLVE